MGFSVNKFDMLTTYSFASWANVWYDTFSTGIHCRLRNVGRYVVKWTFFMIDWEKRGRRCLCLSFEIGGQVRLYFFFCFFRVSWRATNQDKRCIPPPTVSEGVRSRPGSPAHWAQPSVGSYPLFSVIGCWTRKRVFFECFRRFHWYVSRLLNSKRLSPRGGEGFSKLH